MNGELRCPKCHGDKFTYVSEGTYKCAYCGNVFTIPKQENVQVPEKKTEVKPIVINVQAPVNNKAYYASGSKSKTTAAILALLFGEWGAHWFYLGNTKGGWFYFITWLLFCWTGVAPAILAIIGIVYFFIFLFTDQQTFEEKYVRPFAK